ncbi:MAG: glycosyltransferase [Phascolarctobacterium sp.]|nr:glycosyltransferase [Phascolarctobacterium sp.]
MGNYFVSRGYEVAFVGMDTHNGVPYFPVSSEINLYNIGGKDTNKQIMLKLKRLLYISKKARHKFDRDLAAKSIASKLKNIIFNEKPDIIISFHIKDTYIIKKHIEIDCPVITMFHCQPEVYFKEILFDTEVLSTTQQSDCLQVLLPSFIDNVRNYIKHDNVVSIGNVVIPSTNISNVENSKIIMHIGRVSRKDKRQHLIIEAFNKLRNLYPDWSVEFWGDTQLEEGYYKQCCELIKEYGLGNRVKFMGTTTNINAQLSRAAIFAFPSAYEGFSLALTEAMSIGLPSVGFSNCPSVNELIKNGSNGILCGDTVQKFAEGLKELMDDANKRKRYGQQAKEDMKEYAPENIWNKWEELIHKTILEYKLKDNSK